jgi:hypothetical protein
VSTSQQSREDDTTTQGDSERVEKGDEKTFGNDENKKEKDCWRVGLLNYGGFALKSCQRRICGCKDCNFRARSKKMKVDVVLVTETDVHWQSVQVENRLRERTRGWWEAIHIRSAYYKAYRTSRGSAKQYGGTAIFSINKAVHRVMASGEDPTGLARWTWTLYRGKNGITLRLVAAYRPVKNTTGASSVWSQQRQYLVEKGDTRCPRVVMQEDLATAIDGWIKQGNQIVLGIDANEDVRSNRRGGFSDAMRKVGLEETITKQHGNNGPPTSDANEGSDPIDGIYVSRTLRNLKCGYTTQWTDHRMLWIDLPTEMAFGSVEPVIPKAQARRLILNDPRVVQKYMKDYKNHIKGDELLKRTQAFYDTVTAEQPLTKEQEDEWERIDEIRTKGMIESASKCRKFKTGEIEWTPTYQTGEDKTKFLQIKKKELEGRRVNGQFIARLARRGYGKEGEEEAKRWTMREVKEKLTELYAQKKLYKAKGSENRDTFIYQLAEAKAK